MTSILNWLILLFIGCLLWGKGMFSLDPDFGFHLRMGQVILEQGIPATDPFSYTMPSFPDIDEAWLLDVAIATLYPKIGMSGLAVIFAVITLGALWIMEGLAGWHRRRLKEIVLTLNMTVLLLFAGVRPQAFSLFFLAIVLRILLNKRWNRYGRFALPFLFTLWSNVHGGFVAGLATMGVVVALSLLRRFTPRNDSYDHLC